MNELMAKQFEGNEIRIAKDELDNFWFVAKDVMEILSLKNTSMAMKKLKKEEKGISITDTLGGKQEMLTVNESGLYALIFQSRKKAAVDFRYWVTNEVLPSIRKTGSYNKRDLTPAERLYENAKVALENERRITEVSNKLENVETKVSHVENEVVNVKAVVIDMQRHRSGMDPVPKGSITLKQIRNKYFTGITEVIISEYLHKINHPCNFYTYMIGNAEYSSKCYTEAGMMEAYKKFIREVSVVKDVPTGRKCNHPLLDKTFVIKQLQG